MGPDIHKLWSHLSHSLPFLGHKYISFKSCSTLPSWSKLLCISANNVIIPSWHHWKPSHTYRPLKALEFCKQHCNLRRCHSIRQRHTIGSLEKNTEVNFSNNYVLYFGIVIFILDDYSCMSPFKMLPADIECSLLLYNQNNSSRWVKC